MLGHKSKLNKFKGIEIIQIAKQNGIKLETNNIRKFGKIYEYVEIKYTLQNNQLVKEEIIREIRKYFEMSENENTTFQNLWEASKAVFRGKFIAVKCQC